MARAEICLLVLLEGCTGSCGGSPPPAPLEPTHMSRVVLSVEDAVATLLPDARQASYRDPTIEERRLLAELVTAMWRGDDPALDGAAGRAAALGFLIERWEVGGKSYRVVRERSDRLRGAGTYIVRAGPAPAGSLLLQAPHADFDVGTGRIAARMFLAGAADDPARALFLSSLHRYQMTPGKRLRRPNSPPDPCHNPDHLLASATSALLAAAPPPRLVAQLHGFGEAASDDDDDDGAAGGPIAADAIVSGGIATATPVARAVAGGLGRDLGVRALVYPDEVARLGGTRNVEGRLARAQGAWFLHLEMSAPLRKRLEREPAARAGLARALGEGLAAAVAGPAPGEEP